ncbi:MAG: hypothetical protein QXD04_04370 [Candidatus Bathyarchaeia archaeon]
MGQRGDNPQGAIKRLIEGQKGPWLRADQVRPGDTITIEKLSLDETTFER